MQQAIKLYQDQANGLATQPADPMHPAEIRAMRSLADALSAFPNSPDQVPQAAGKLRDDADKIEHSKPTDVHSDTIKDGLSGAVDALDALRTSGPQTPDINSRITDARAAVDKIDAATPTLQERAVVDDAFVKIGNALVVIAQARQAVSMERQPVSGEEGVATAQATPYHPGIGFNLSAGGGVVDFADNAAKNLTRIGGMWDVRFIIASHYWLAGEVAYVGTVNGVNNVMAQFAPGGFIVGSAVEFDARLQIPLSWSPVRPYGFFGVGWNNYTLTGEDFRNPLAINHSDNSVVLPYGGGIEWDITDHVDLDTRFTYRALFGEDLLHTNVNGIPGVGSQGMSQWSWSARLGYTF
jgi:opacity protein-like surface antigen